MELKNDISYVSEFDPALISCLGSSKKISAGLFQIYNLLRPSI